MATVGDMEGLKEAIANGFVRLEKQLLWRAYSLLDSLSRLVVPEQR